MNHHLVILKKLYLELIVSGRKTIELRLSTGRSRLFGRVQPGDGLFLKVSAGPVCARATVADVKCYETLTPPRIARIKRQYNDRIMGGDAVWESLMDRKSGLLVWLRDVRRIEPIRIEKKDWRAWVVLNEGKDFGLLDKTGV
jgi:ASC-1-like (ASCH) protein